MLVRRGNAVLRKHIGDTLDSGLPVFARAPPSQRQPEQSEEHVDASGQVSAVPDIAARNGDNAAVGASHNAVSVPSPSSVSPPLSAARIRGAGQHAEGEPTKAKKRGAKRNSADVVGSDEEEDEPRRSTRQRGRPVEFWKIRQGTK
jgi:hypothetical protein